MALALPCFEDVIFARGMTSNDTTTTLSTLLINEVRANNIKAVKSLLKQNVDINCRDRNGWTPLMHAVSAGDNEMVKLLLNPGILNRIFRGIKKADVNLTNDEGKTALDIAKKAGKENIISTLKKHGAKDNVITQRVRSTDSEYTVNNDSLIGVADVNWKNENGQTKLMIAAAQGNKNEINLLIKSGAAANAKDSKGMNALMYAASSGRIEVITLLINACVRQLKIVHDDPFTIYREVLKIINQKDKDDMTALMHAVNNNQIEAITALIKIGADRNCKNKDGMTALMIAASQSYEEAVLRLLQHDSMNVKDNKNQTAFAYAVDSDKEKNNVNTVNAFLARGANPNDHNNKYIPLLALATMKCKYRIVDMLLRSGAKVNTSFCVDSPAVKYTALSLAEKKLAELRTELNALQNSGQMSTGQLSEYSKEQQFQLMQEERSQLNQKQQSKKQLEKKIESLNRIIDLLKQAGATK